MSHWTQIVRFKQVAQRSTEWYAIRGKYVTGSDFASLVPLTDAYLKHYFDFFHIQDKTYKATKYGKIKTLKEWYGSRIQPKSSVAHVGGGFSAADHGVLFEDIVLNLVAQQMQTIAKPLGLVLCPHNACCAISPDGILCFEKQPAMSLELKCVTTREITTECIPFPYFMQTEFAAWQLGCTHGLYCEADIMQVSEVYWEEHHADEGVLKPNTHTFGLLLYHEEKKQHVLPHQFVRTPQQFRAWRDAKIKDNPVMWRTIYYKVNAMQLLKIPVRDDFESLFENQIKYHHDQLMSYTADPEKFVHDFPSRSKVKEDTKSTAERRSNTSELWIDGYAGDIVNGDDHKIGRPLAPSSGSPGRSHSTGSTPVL